MSTFYGKQCAISAKSGLCVCLSACAFACGVHTSICVCMHVCVHAANATRRLPIGIAISIYRLL